MEEEDQDKKLEGILDTGNYIFKGKRAWLFKIMSSFCGNTENKMNGRE